MTSYVFETMTAADAASFTAADTLVFSNQALTPVDVTASSSEHGLNLTTLTAAGKSLVFAGASLRDGDIQFVSSFQAGKDATLAVGTFGNDAGGNFIEAHSEDGDIVYGFGGDDDIRGRTGGDNLFGGAGADIVSGFSGADHIYGFGLSGNFTADGADTLFGGDGNDYIQGNAGNDVLDGGTGNDRLVGGAGDDSIYGGDGNDTVNGNKGDDFIAGDNSMGAAGNDSLRGGAGDDQILGRGGNDIVIGDLGDDTLNGGVGIDLLTGGEGHDIFVFFSGNAPLPVGGTGPLADFVDTITDFTIGDDTVYIGNVGQTEDDVLHAQAGIAFSSLTAATTYAQQLLDAHTGTQDVAVIDVGSDSYLFYNGAGGATVDSVIKLDGVHAADFKAASIELDVMI